MLDILNPAEAAAVLCMLMLGANGENKPEEVGSMLTNPFFKEHIAEKIGHPAEFLKKYNQSIDAMGPSGLEKKSIAALNGGYPAFKLKTLAMMTLIAGADNDYDRTEKELMARVSTNLGISMEELAPEVEKMKAAILETKEPPPEKEG